MGKKNYVQVKANEEIIVRMYKPRTTGKGKKKGKPRAMASLTITTSSGRIVVYGNAIDGKNGWFFSYPQYKASDGEYKNLVFALDKEVNEALSEALDDCACRLEEVDEDADEDADEDVDEDADEDVDEKPKTRKTKSKVK